MTQRDKLKKVIERSVENGFMPDTDTIDVSEHDGSLQPLMVYFNYDDDGTRKTWTRDVYSTLFDHSFAKAYWGEDKCCRGCGQTPKNASGHCAFCDNSDDPYWTPIWQYHLQQAVLSESPVDYFYDNMPKLNTLPKEE